MNQENNSLNALEDIKKMMERSSRFISLSGWSGISAGICALIGGGFAYKVLHTSYDHPSNNYETYGRNSLDSGFSMMGLIESKIFLIAIFTLIAALVLAFFFTLRNSKKKNVPMWSSTSRRLIQSMSVPLFAGGVFALYLAFNGYYGLIAPSLLTFYGLAIVNASKYTLIGTIWLGYAEVALGLINLLFIGYGLYFWIVGFGLLHIIYGIVMWYQYERIQQTV